jgi:hypothetical protein
MDGLSNDTVGLDFANRSNTVIQSSKTPLIHVVFLNYILMKDVWRVNLTEIESELALSWFQHHDRSVLAPCEYHESR